MPEHVAYADMFFEAIGADIFSLVATEPTMHLATDHIQMPQFAAFTENVAYYSTLAHEPTHWTLHTKRCDRQLRKRFGDYGVWAEELIVELDAALTCAHLGLSTEPHEVHAQYINSWLTVLKADSKAISPLPAKLNKLRTGRSHEPVNPPPSRRWRHDGDVSGARRDGPGALAGQPIDEMVTRLESCGAACEDDLEEDPAESTMIWYVLLWLARTRVWLFR
jgi:hypothetical protein